MIKKNTLEKTLCKPADCNKGLKGRQIPIKKLGQKSFNFEGWPVYCGLLLSAELKSSGITLCDGNSGDTEKNKVFLSNYRGCCFLFSCLTESQATHADIQLHTDTDVYLHIYLSEKNSTQWQLKLALKSFLGK